MACWQAGAALGLACATRARSWIVFCVALFSAFLARGPIASDCAMVSAPRLSRRVFDNPLEGGCSPFGAATPACSRILVPHSVILSMYFAPWEFSIWALARRSCTGG